MHGLSRWFLDREGVEERESIPRETVGDVLHAKETYVRLSDERCICLFELIDASHFHCCSLHAQASLSANHPNNVRHRALAAVATISATLS